MTGIVAYPQSIFSGSSSTSLTSLEPAISQQTMAIAHGIQALQNGPLPSSVRLDTRPDSIETPIHERLFDALAAAKVLTSRVAMHLTLEWRDKLFRQLDSLHDPAEWEEGDLPVHQASFMTFLKAMLTINPARRPGLGLSHVGNLIAAWTTGKDRLTIEFMPHDRIRWVLSLHYDDGPVRYAGDAPVGRLNEGLAKHNPEHWFLSVSEDRKYP
jgi:hypothetical protein